MFIDLCEINDKYRGADRDINPKLFSLNNNCKLDFKLYCDFCNYELEFNGEEKIISDRLNMLEKLRKKNNNIELILFDRKPIENIFNLKFLGFDILNEHFESPLSYEDSEILNKNLQKLNDYFLFQTYLDVKKSLIENPSDETGSLLTIYYIYKYSV